jgi:N-dimethylarginine dimethylaminohydrolase
MNFPFTLDASVANNPLMEVIKDRAINHEVAFSQFLAVYHFVTKNSLVYLLPSEGNFQDQVYVANLGMHLPHLENDTIVVANFKSPPRIGEENVGTKFFESMGYEVFRPPFNWEGEADMKFLRDNIYIGGYGIRTDRRAYDWMTKQFGMQIIGVEMTDPRLYHFDCMCFPLSKDKVMLATSAMSAEDIKAVEKFAEIIDVPHEHKYEGLTNVVRIGNNLLAATPTNQSSIKFFQKLCANQGLQDVIFDLSEFDKSGADLSCMIMHLNYHK